MPTMTHIPSTSRGVLAQVEPFRPIVEGEYLVFTSDLTPDLEAVMSILHTGLRSLLTRRAWWGSSATGSTHPRVAPLNPDAPIPPWCRLLCVDGDTRWDRIGPKVRLNFPRLFTPR